MKKTLSAVLCAIMVLILCIPAAAEQISPKACDHLYRFDRRVETYEELTDTKHNIVNTEYWKCVKCGHITVMPMNPVSDYHYLRIVNHGCYSGHHIYEIKCDLCAFSVVDINDCTGNPHLSSPFSILVDLTGRTVSWLYRVTIPPFDWAE